MKNNIVISAAVVVAFLALVGYLVSIAPEKMAEIQGSDTEASWVTTTDSATGVTYKYPETLGAKYVTAVDWPPQVQVTEEEVVCMDAGEEGARAGKTETRIINGREYCITEIVEAAAGSMYTLYAYGAELGGKYAFFVFSTRKPQCANFPEPEASECKSEQESFNIDDLADKIISSAKIK